MVMIYAVSIGDIAYNSHWYAMSPADKVIIEMIIRRSQRPFEIKGLGVLVCSLETFLRVWQQQQQQQYQLNLWKSTAILESYFFFQFFLIARIFFLFFSFFSVVFNYLQLFSIIFPIFCDFCNFIKFFQFFLNFLLFFPCSWAAVRFLTIWFSVNWMQLMNDAYAEKKLVEIKAISIKKFLMNYQYKTYYENAIMKRYFYPNHPNCLEITQL